MKTKSLTDYWKRNKCPLILDVEIGGKLQISGAKLHPHLWASFFNITDPQVIIKLHKGYIEAGADISTTNTLRTNPIADDKSNLSISNFEFVNSSVQPTKTASKYNDEIIIAGSNPPAEEQRIFSGELFSHTIDLVLEHYPIAISVNCIFQKIYRKLFADYTFNYAWGFYLNCGSSYYTDDQIVKGISPIDTQKRSWKILMRIYCLLDTAVDQVPYTQRY